jgi:transcription elongation factor Elf1
MFDQYKFKFSCDCGHQWEELISRLEGIDTVSCPKCGKTTDLREEPHATVLQEIRELAAQHDNISRKRGETIERLG